MEVVIRSTRDPSACSPWILGHFRFASGVSFVIAKIFLLVVVNVVMEVGAIWIIDASFGAFPRITQSHEQRKVVAFTGEEITAAFPGVSAVITSRFPFHGRRNNQNGHYHTSKDFISNFLSIQFKKSSRNMSQLYLVSLTGWKVGLAKLRLMNANVVDFE